MTSTWAIVGAALILSIVFIVIVMMLVSSARRNRSPSRNAAVAPPRSDATEPVQTWSPPHYAAPEATKPAGPSLRVGVSIIQPQPDSMLISWNAINDGAGPVAINWGAPEVLVAGDGSLVLRYALAAGADLPPAPSDIRVVAPGEIVSRSATIPASAVPAGFGGLRVSVAVAYGPAGGQDAGSTDGASTGGASIDGAPSDGASTEGASTRGDASAAWEKTAVSAPRNVPR